MQDREKIKELNIKIKELQGTLESKNNLLTDYKDIEKIADEKIKGLNTIHSEKVRALMHSIQVLKKDNANLQKQQKEHKRSEIIQQLQKDISDQDTVIEVLRKLLPNPKIADDAIISELTKGPKRVRVQTREELKMEIKTLNGKLLKYQKNKGGTIGEGTMNLDNQSRAGSLANSDTKKPGYDGSAGLINAQIGNNENKLAGNSELIIKINDLNNEIEDLKLLVTGKQSEIDKYKELITKKNREILELNQSTVDLKFMTTKNDELKNEIAELRQRLNSDAYNNYDQQIKLEELELVAKTHKSISTKNNEVAKLELENLQNKIEEISKQNQVYVARISQVQSENKRILKENDDLKDKNSNLYAEQQTQIDSLAKQLKQRDTDIKRISKDSNQMQENFDNLTVDLQNKELKIQELKEKIRNLEQNSARNSMNLDLSNISQKSNKDAPKNRSFLQGQSKQEDVVEIERLQKMTEDLTEEKNQICKKKSQEKMELNHYLQENSRMKLRLKQLSDSEIELCDQVELLQEEIKLKSQKINAMSLMNRYGEMASPELVQEKIKKATQKYEDQIEGLNEKIILLDRRNRDLEEVRKILNQSYSVTDADKSVEK